MTIGLGHYLSVGAILFTLGILGIFLNRKNIIVILMSIELILLSVNINLVAFSTFLGDIVGQVFALEFDPMIDRRRLQLERYLFAGVQRGATESSGFRKRMLKLGSHRALTNKELARWRAIG